MTSPLAVFDGHNDLAWAMRLLNDYDLDAYPVDVRQSRTHTDLVRLREGGVTAQYWSVFVPSHEGVTETIEQIDFVLRMIAHYPDDLALALTADDVERAWQSGRIASLLGAEGGHSIDSSLAVLRALHALGVRYMTLTHNSNVPWADSATDKPVHGGLTDFGRDVVREMNRLGMLVDLSHVAATTMNDALDVTNRPVIFSHSSARAVTDHPRNVPDDVLARLTGNGGVCQVTFVPAFVSQDYADWTMQITAEMAGNGDDPRDYQAQTRAAAAYAEVVPRPTVTIDDVADHVEHVREVAGVDHVGLGGDYDGCDVLPTGLEDVSTYPVLLDVLRARGWSDDDLAALTHRNALRVLRDSEPG